MKKWILSLCILCISIASMAQQVYNSSGKTTRSKPSDTKSSKLFDRDNLVLGGDFRLFFGQNMSLGVAPMLGYKLFDNFSAGVRIGYNFDRIKYDPSQLPVSASTNVFKFNSYVGGIWARYLFYQSIYAHVEGAFNVYEDYYFDDINGDFKKVTYNAPAVLVGVGFTQPISDRASFNTTILYDVLHDPLSYYHYLGGGFDFRFGFLIGF